jgi:hypothetical protein
MSSAATRKPKISKTKMATNSRRSSARLSNWQLPKAWKWLKLGFFATKIYVLSQKLSSIQGRTGVIF